ncbi:uncharacterized protein LOC108041006 isoform X2 [Drosophila rhopaloa]|uniref:Titin n=1 Tax=Drosophila rhopaloa TaxID=1041015 RepID=A0ABM5H485_DRORH|nr:uncharacterized protein LOC108041006 isoform X2 [Drosophila rhopaloa]
MDGTGRQVIMGPPAPVASTSNEPSPGNPSNAPPSEATKSAPPPKRIIKKIQLDFNKLKQAGLDRQLAEVLRNQKLGAQKVETPSSSIPSPSATAQSTSNTAECTLQQPQQQFRQPAPQPMVKRFMISEFIEKSVPIQTTPIPTVYNTTNANRSKHVKTLLKNRILNKNININSQPQQMPTTSKATSPSSAQGSAPRSAAPPAAFSLPIAKADLTIRQKQPPLLLNLVNQLPKHRDLCGSSNKTLMKQPEIPEQNHPKSSSVQQMAYSPQRIAVQQPPQTSTQLLPHHPFQPSPQVPVPQSVSAVPITLHKSPSPPLIVLENKVLAPNEKIDLSGLRLPNAPVSTTLSQVKPSESPVQTSIQSKIIKGKIIMNANKFKVSREKLAEMAKEIRHQVKQVKLPQTPEPVSSKDFTSTTERPFTITTILQQNKPPLFTPATLEGNNVYNPMQQDNELPACSGSSIISNPLPVDNSSTLEPKQMFVAESKEPKEYPKEKAAEASPLEFPVYIPSTLDVKLLPQLDPNSTNTLQLSEHNPVTPESAPEPKEYCKVVATKSSPPKHSEYISTTSNIEEVNTEQNPLDFPVYIPSTQLPSAVATESNSLLPVHTAEAMGFTEEKDAENSRPAYIPLTPEKISLPEKVTTASNAADLSKPEEFHEEVPTETSFLDLPVCIPSTCETKEFAKKESAEPIQPVLTHGAPTTSKLNAFSVKPNTESSYLASPAVQKVETAVDFIAQLAAENPLDESAFLDLSPEEQRLNALFGGGECCYMGVSPVDEPQQPQEDLSIGKIVQMDNMNILHATLDVHSDSTNVLRISPSAVRLQSSVAKLDMSLADIDEVADSVLEENKVQVNLPEQPAQAATKPSVVKSLAFESTSEEPKGDARSPEVTTTILAENPSTQKEFEVPLEEIKPVSDTEPVHEVNPPAKRTTTRSKRAKINLVQRSKRPSIPKTFEAKKTRLEFEEGDDEAMAIDHSLLEDRYGVTGIEVPTDEKQCEEVSKSSKEVRVEETCINPQEVLQISTKSTTERDLTQLYHPPKMPKNKPSKKNSAQETLEDSQPTPSCSNVSLIDILSQDVPPAQGEAQIPFRKESIELNSNVNRTSDITGVQNLIGHLTAENVTPQFKKLSPTPKSEETSKPMTRKKLVKTRPILSKRSSKVSQKVQKEKSNHFEFLHPVSANVGGRIPTSSTSDDDGSIFLGFDNKEEKSSKTPVRSKRVRQMKLNETDISDDATPDYDETEEEQQSTERQPQEKNCEIDTQFTTNKPKVVGAFSDDSDSSSRGPTSPMDFGDNVSIDEDRACEVYPVRESTNWEKLVNASEQVEDKKDIGTNEKQDYPTETAVKSKVDRLTKTEDPPKIDGGISNTHLVEALSNASDKHNDQKSQTFMEENQKKSVIGKQDSTISDSKLRKSTRKSTKSNAPFEVDTTNEPSTSKDCLTNIRTKRQTRGRSITSGSLDDRELKGVLEDGDAVQKPNVPSALTENLHHLDCTENSDLKKTVENEKGKPKTTQRKSVESENTVSKNVENAAKEILEDVKDPENKNILLTTGENTILIEDQQGDQKTSAKSKGKRKSRSLAPIIKVTPATQPDVVANTQLKSESKVSKNQEEENLERVKPPEEENVKQEESKSVEEPDTSLKSKRNRKSRCTTPKIKVLPDIQHEVGTKPDQTSGIDGSKDEEEPFTASEKPFVHTENELFNVPGESNDDKSCMKPKEKRQSRYSSIKSVSATPAVSGPEKTSDRLITAVNKDSTEDRDTLNASVDATQAVNPKRKRKSRSTTPMLLVPPVVKAQEILDSSNSNTDLQEKLEEVKASEEANLSTTSVKTKKTRQSRSSTAKVTISAVTQPEPAPNPEEDLAEMNEPIIPKRQRGKRQSRISVKSNVTAPSSTPSEEPQPVEETRVTRKTFGSVTPDTPITSVNTPKDKEDSESAPTKGGGSNANSVPADPKSRKLRTSNFSEMISPKHEEPKVPAKRGRKRAAPVDTEIESAKKLKTDEGSETVSIVEFNLRLLLIRKREQLDSEEDLTENGKGEGPLQCGLCMKRSDKKNWQTHLGEHYGVGWPIGDTPKKITRAWVMTMMKNHLQNSSEKLICRLCNHQLGTPLGMLLHLEGCGNKQRIPCDFCNKLYTKLSLPGHIRTCPKRHVFQNEDDQEPADGDVVETVYSNAGRAKRKSTIKAETKLKKIGQELTSQKTGEETTAKNDFDGDSSDYDMAKDNESSEEYNSEGVDSNEDSLSTEDEGSLADNLSTTKRTKTNERGHINRKRKINRPVNTGESQQKPLLSRYHHLEARATHKWNEFVQSNYKADPLFSRLLPRYSKVSTEESNGLLPSKETTSMRYAYGNVSKEDDWKQLGPFEGFSKKGEYVSFLGRPIKQLAWVPLPPKIADQYLLCYLRPKMKTYARHTKLKDEEALLLLLKCTVVSDKPADKSWGLRPELHYGIRVPNGPVHSFCFLPSGGYDKSSNRLGLLAVGNSLSDVHIYALPLELTEDRTADDNVLIQLQSMITLSLDVNKPVQDQCTKICWSQALNHNFLATGYASGNIAFWDIGDTDSINCFNRNDETYFAPLNYFYIGERNVQFMDIHYDNNGPRWLAVGTSIRQFIVYDIANWSKPAILTQDSICTLYMANMTWSPICETLVVSSSHFTRTIAVSPSGIQFEHRTLDGTLTTTREMHTNCQQNHMVFVTDNGDLVFLDVRDLNCGPALLKSLVNRRVVSTTELHHLGATTPKTKDPISADEFLRDYGVQINPLVPAPHKKKSSYLDAKRRPQNVHTLALTRFNCVRCNWNSPAHTWVAMGAEHGLLRILNFDRDKFF